MVIPVILSGGAGTRLWPVSRESHPKPFIKLADGESLLQKTFLRANALDDIQEILTITNREYYFKTHDEYNKIAHNTKLTFLLEPFGRNTAPAILLAALKVLATHGPDAVLLILPADHLIETNDMFANAFAQAHKLAEQNKIVTFGIIPTEPETAFGYIECGKTADAAGNYPVTRFVEKPSIDLAQEYIAAGNYLWNSGIFCFKAGVIVEQFKHHAPALFQLAEECWTRTQKSTFKTDSITELNSASFAELPDISIDYALMEKSNDIMVVPSQFSWNDVGSWDRMIKLFKPDANHNITLGETIMIDSQDTFIYGDQRLVAAIGTEHLIIVDTPDALLVACRNHTQDVKQIVQQLKTKHTKVIKHIAPLFAPGALTPYLKKAQTLKSNGLLLKQAPHYHCNHINIAVNTG